jgi:hypothetical protein
MWAYQAFLQGDAPLGRALLLEAVRLKPSIVKGKPCELISNLIVTSISDQRDGHDALLRQVLGNLPPELVRLREHYRWAVAQGFLQKATQALLWSLPENGLFAKALALGAEMDEFFTQMITSQLLDYRTEFGPEAAEAAIRRLGAYMGKTLGWSSVRKLRGCYSINAALRSYHKLELDGVTAGIIRGVAHAPKYLANRGVVAVGLRSLYRRLF